MPLTAGDRLGPYEILALIGSGGMGEVYRARDSKLKRDVALKVLPAPFASDANRMARFEREARVLASLNHPNIAQIYGVEERALVMELVEGESPKGPMPFDDAWKIALQIADALEYAHDKGVIHRDLKPSNVKVTPEGVVKLLDFGLAKAYSDQTDASSGDPALSPTLTLGATVAGTIMGTAAYMAPEQARGKQVDKRADIWSWGVVLYELLTGERLFQGEDAAETLAAVIHKQPDLERVPPKVRRLLGRCLERDPKKRLRDVAVAKELLEQTPQATPRPTSKLPWMVAGGVLLVLSAALSWGLWWDTRPLEHALVRLEVDLGSDVSLPPPEANAIGDGVILSPDGTRLAYIASVGGGQTRLFTRRLDQPKATELPGTDGATDAFFSSDGQWIGFANIGRVSKISVEGGPAVPLANLTLFGGASWGEDGSIVVSEPLGRGLLRIPSAGGSETPLLPQPKGIAALPFPQILAHGKALLFLSAGLDAGTSRIDVLTLADHRQKDIARGAASPHYLPISDHEGYLVYTHQSTLFAVLFDLDKLETRGNAVRVLDDVAYSTNPEGGMFSYSPSGTLVYRKGSRGAGPGASIIQWVDTAGTRETLLAKPGDYRTLNFSPHGKQLALEVGNGSGSELRVYDPERGSQYPLTFGQEVNSSLPVWVPDGKYVVFSSGNTLWWTRGDGTGQPQQLIRGDGPMVPSSFSPDGKHLAYFAVHGGPPQIWTVPVEEDGPGLKAGTPEQFLKDQFVDMGPVFSTDGDWLAYESNASGKFEVYVRAFPSPASGQGGKPISSGGGPTATLPRWAHSGQELYYQAGDQIMAVSYSVKGGAFRAEKPRMWIPKVGGTLWDLSPDGKHIAVITPVGGTQAPVQDHEVVFLLNFLDYLKQQVPLNK